MDVEITVSPAAPENTEAITQMLNEMDTFYGASDLEPSERRASNIHEALFSGQPATHLLLAWDGDRPVGLASYAFLWPASGSSRSIYLKELYVTGDHRGAGVGRLLMDRLREIAEKNACDRVEWTTDVDNLRAQQFYKRLGFEPNPAKLFYRLELDH